MGVYDRLRVTYAKAWGSRIGTFKRQGFIYDHVLVVYPRLHTDGVARNGSVNGVLDGSELLSCSTDVESVIYGDVANCSAVSYAARSSALRYYGIEQMGTGEVLVFR
ncbi:hypothetical protein ES703_68010 [subsurface metagenome]